MSGITHHVSRITYHASRIAFNTLTPFSLLLTAYFLLLLPRLTHAQTPTSTPPPRNGVLTGQVINGTTGQPQGGLEIALRAFSPDNTEISTWTGQADSAGRYTFTQLPTEHTIFYVVEGQYQNITYRSSDPAVFTPNSAKTTLNLNVYKTTAADQPISIGQLHTILTFAPDTVNVVQIIVLTNQGNSTYIGRDGQTFAFALPPNAANIDFEEDFPGARFRQTANGYADTAPILPGTDNWPLAVRYEVPFKADTLTLALPIPADTSSLNVLMSEQGAELTSDQLQLIETRSIQGDMFQIFGGAHLQQGDTLTLRLSGLDKLTFAAASGATDKSSSPAPVNQNLLRWLVISVGGLALIAAGVVYPLLRPRLAQPPRLSYNDPQTRRQKLLLTLARLDEAFAAGELEEVVYRQARARYKAELVRMMEE